MICCHSYSTDWDQPLLSVNRENRPTLAKAYLEDE
jgi:hypothetical protein